MTRSDIQPISPAVQRLIADFQSKGRIRSWSLIVTAFGDCIMPRGGRISLASLQKLIGGFGIEPNALRTALSRLSNDGLIERRRHGRQSSYALSGQGQMLFEKAGSRIYSAAPSEWDGKLEIVLLKSLTGLKRKKQRRSLIEKGFGEASPGVMIRPLEKYAAQVEFPVLGQFSGTSLGDTGLGELVANGWPLSELNKSYAQLISQYKPLLGLIVSGSEISPYDSVLIRILLIHEWRRLVLKDVDLPASLKPENWVGENARELVKSLYLGLLEESETFLDQLEALPGKRLGEATVQRFGAE